MKKLITTLTAAMLLSTMPLFAGNWDKDDTVRYHSKCMEMLNKSNKKAESSRTIIGYISAQKVGLNQIITLAPNGDVDPVVIMKMRYRAKLGKVYYDEMDAEIAAIFKGALIGFALGLDFGGATWGGSSLAAYAILESDNTKEKSAEADLDRANLALDQYMYEHSYFE